MMRTAGVEGRSLSMEVPFVCSKRGEVKSEKERMKNDFLLLAFYF